MRFPGASAVMMLHGIIFLNNLLPLSFTELFFPDSLDFSAVKYSLVVVWGSLYNFELFVPREFLVVCLVIEDREETHTSGIKGPRTVFNLSSFPTHQKFFKSSSPRRLLNPSFLLLSSFSRFLKF